MRAFTGLILMGVGILAYNITHSLWTLPIGIVGVALLDRSGPQRPATRRPRRGHRRHHLPHLPVHRIHHLFRWPL